MKVGSPVILPLPLVHECDLVLSYLNIGSYRTKSQFKHFFDSSPPLFDSSDNSPKMLRQTIRIVTRLSEPVCVCLFSSKVTLGPEEVGRSS